jgi:hypothetical protein
MTHPTPPPPDLGPPRCDAAEITAMLAAAAQPGSHLLVHRAPDDVPGPVEFVTASLWSCSLWRTPGWLDWTMSAVTPDGRTWSHGCQRHWDTTGDVIEPLDGLTDRQRVALEHRLVMAAEMPEREPLSMDQAVASILPAERTAEPRPHYQRRKK